MDSSPRSRAKASPASQVEPILGAVRCVVVEHLDPTSALSFRCVHRGIRTSQHDARTGAGAPENGSDAGRYVKLFAADREWRGETSLDDAARRRDVGEVANSVDEYNELVTSEPGQHIAGPDRGPQPQGHLLEQFVADLMAQAVVDRLEFVNVAE